MTKVLYLDSASNNVQHNISSYQQHIHNSSVQHIDTFTQLVVHLVEMGSQECDSHEALVVIINPLNTSNNTSNNTLNLLKYQDQISLLKFFFSHFNLVVCKVSDLIISVDFSKVNLLIGEINKKVSHRILRVHNWTGTSAQNHDNLENLPTMSNCLSKILNGSSQENANIKYFADLLDENINFDVFLQISSQRKNYLISCIGHWNFPAHELSNVDLQYCSYLILKHAINQISGEEEIHTLLPSDNKLKLFISTVRDLYKAGNPFHNFRHAVDVLQATFYYLIKLRCLPAFKEFSEMYDEECNNIPGAEASSSNSNTEIGNDGYGERLHSKYLSPSETLALLVAAIGHDVGHPGTTNAFMIKYKSPISLVFNERSVLESFHSAAFNKILSIVWPINSDQKSKDIIISSILATDMAEHFEYVSKIKRYNNDLTNESDKLKIICSLIIKCADISNVTRPLRVSSQWGVSLSREFNEILILEKYLTNNENEVELESFKKYDILPTHLEMVLMQNTDLAKGQIFFINTFASSLFKSVVDIFPELFFTWEIIENNKLFWENLNK